jgi:hypothetical protein
MSSRSTSSIQKIDLTNTTNTSLTTHSSSTIMPITKIVRNHDGRSIVINDINAYLIDGENKIQCSFPCHVVPEKIGYINNMWYASSGQFLCVFFDGSEQIDLVLEPHLDYQIGIDNMIYLLTHNGIIKYFEIDQEQLELKQIETGQVPNDSNPMPFCERIQAVGKYVFAFCRDIVKGKTFHSPLAIIVPNTLPEIERVYTDSENRFRLMYSAQSLWNCPGTRYWSAAHNKESDVWFDGTTMFFSFVDGCGIGDDLDDGHVVNMMADFTHAMTVKLFSEKHPGKPWLSENPSVTRNVFVYENTKANVQDGYLIVNDACYDLKNNIRRVF